MLFHPRGCGGWPGAWGDVAPGQVVQLAVQLVLVAFDDEGVVGAWVLRQVAGVFVLGAHRVGGDHFPAQVQSF